VPPGDYTVTALRESEYLSTLFQKGKPAPGNRIRIVPGSSPAIEIVARTATAAVEVKVEGDWRSWPSSPLSVVAIPDDGWDDPYSWTGPVWYDTRPVALRVGRPGSYLIFATQNLSGHVIEAWADELRRHEKQAVRVIVKDGLVETVTLRPVVLDATDVGASQSK
jgi:hypothetical protein